jgi:acetylornithine/succinyldiaminopimelate/putrescine aminotransferase
VTPADPAFLQAARELCDQYNAALIFDEVQCGFGRSGSLYAYMQYGIEPDILTTAKALGGGFPIAGMLAREKFALSFSPGTHGSTYGGNPLASAVALKSLEIISRPEVMEGVKTRRQLFVDGFEALNKKYHLFKNIRGMGLLLGCELEDKYAGRAREILRAGQEAGVLLLVAGGSVLRFTPSLVIDEADIAEGLKRLDVALASFV